jgi:hypothetical protein
MTAHDLATLASELAEYEERQLAARTLGRKGGQSRSPAKLAAVRRNLERAWERTRKPTA